MGFTQIKLNTHLLKISENPPRSLRELLLDTKQDFSLQPWYGVRFYLKSAESILRYDSVDSRVRTISELQELASIFRELTKFNEIQTAICALNVEASPELPGNIGSIFGFNVLIILWITESDFSYEILPYSSALDTIMFNKSTDSDIKDMWEARLGEPFENCVKRLFLPMEEGED